MAENDLEALIFLLPPPSAGTTGMHHYTSIMLKKYSRTLGILGRPSPNWVYLFSRQLSVLSTKNTQAWAQGKQRWPWVRGHLVLGTFFHLYTGVELWGHSVALHLTLGQTAGMFSSGDKFYPWAEAPFPTGSWTLALLSFYNCSPHAVSTCVKWHSLVIVICS